MNYYVNFRHALLQSCCQNSLHKIKIAFLVFHQCIMMLYLPVQENLGSRTKFGNSVPQRPPFSVQNHNTVWTPHQKQSTTAIEAVKTNILLTYERMKCPSCGSPSRKTANDTCECDECKEIFCSLCQHRVDKNHKTGKCGIKVNKSKKNKSKEAIGSKKSKDRLKRYQEYLT